MSARGLSLLETVLALVVVGIVGATVAPLVGAISDTTRDAMDGRDAAERAAYAIDQAVRMLREVPINDDTGELGITTAEPQRVVFSDGRALALVGTDLMLTDASGNTGVLCREVGEFSLAFIGGDGATDTSATPAQARRVVIVLATGGIELAACACPRVTLGAMP